MERRDLAEAKERHGKDDDAASRLSTYEIFSILESKFLFGCGPGSFFPRAPAASLGARTRSKVCVLSIDGGARPVDGLLAACALVRLEAALRRRSKQDDARLADFFDVAAGSGAGGVLAAMLFARDPQHGGRPMYSAEDALGFLLRRVRRGGRWSSARGASLLPVRRRNAEASFGILFGELTLRDTVRPVLVPCYDLATRAPLLFSRADAAVHDFRLRDVCAATCAAGRTVVEVRSVDGVTRVAALGGGAALGNPTAAAITHVLNNRREFPAAATVDDLLVMSIGTGEDSSAAAAERSRRRSKSKPPEMARIAAEGVSDMVDQAVAMAFGQSRASNYVRIQGTGSRRSAGGGGRAPRMMACGGETDQQAAWKAEAVLLQKGVESVLFQGRRLAGETNAEKLEWFARELAREHVRRKEQKQPEPPAAGVVPPPPPAAVLKKQPATAPRTNIVTSTVVTSASAVVVTTEAAAARGPPPSARRRRRITQVSATTTTTVAAPKRTPETMSSSASRRTAVPGE